MPQEAKSKVKHNFDTAMHSLKLWSGGQGNGVVMRAYNMQEARSSRPSEVRMNEVRQSEVGLSTTTSMPRQDSNLLRRSQ